MPKKCTPEEIKTKIFELKSAGHTSRQIAWILRVSQSTVVRFWENFKSPLNDVEIAFEDLTKEQQHQIMLFREHDLTGEIERGYMRYIANLRGKNVRPNN